MSADANSSLLAKTMAMANEAVAHDTAGRYHQALRLYVTSLDHFDVLLRHERNDAMRTRIRAKVTDYLTRAEVLKAFLKDNLTDDDAAGAVYDQGTATTTTPMSERPTTQWTEIVGAEEAKQTLFEAVAFPIRFPSLFTNGGALRPWSGILLYGPPGTGKTMLAKAAAASAEATFYAVSAATIMAKYVGESERAVRSLFETARANAPAIIFVDEVDSMLIERSDDTSESSGRVKTEFFVQMDGMNNRTGVLVLGTTNRPWALDTAALRRFERRVYVPLPDAPARRQLFEMGLRTVANHQVNDRQLTQLAEATDGFSCADIDVVVRRATMALMREAALATHFQKNEKTGRWQSSASSSGHAMTLADVPHDALELRPLRADDLVAAVAASSTTVRSVDLERYAAFALAI